MSHAPMLRSVAGIVAASVDATWEALLASIPELTGQDARALARATSAQRIEVPIDPSSGTNILFDIDPKRRRVTVEGQWWYRGVTSVESDKHGSLVAHRVYNIAPGATRWLVFFVHRHDEDAFRGIHERLLRGIGKRLGCDVYLLGAGGDAAAREEPPPSKPGPKEG